MKKKVVAPKRKTPTVKRTAPKKTRVSQPGVITVQRIVIFSACIVLVLAGVISFNKPAINQSVAGASVARGLFVQSTVDLPEVEGAVSYNIYYKKTGADRYDNAVRNVPVTADAYTISHLKKGVSYDYQIAAVDAQGEEFWFSLTKQLSNFEAM